MTSLVVLAVIAGLFALNILILRTNAGVVALALMSGFVLNTYAGSELAIMATGLIRSNPELLTTIAHLACILMPALLIMWFLRRTATGQVGVLNVPLAILSGLLILLFCIPQLPVSVQGQYTSTDFWQSIRQYQVVLVCTTLLFATGQFWQMRPRHEGKPKKSKHK